MALREPTLDCRLRERFLDVVHFGEHDRGGHFAAMEVPETLVAEMRTCFAALRQP